MDISDLRYIVEVNKAQSISKAASNLFISQPNLSKAISNVEHEAGFIIFKRTPQGVIPTDDGKKFIIYAQTLISQFDEFESMFKPDSQNTIKFSVSYPRATYISVALANYLSRINQNLGLSINIKETNSLETIHNVSTSESELGIIRYQTSQEDYFLGILENNKLSYEVLCQYPQMIILSKDHPLANKEEIFFHELLPYTEIVHGDIQKPSVSYHTISKNADTLTRRISVYERGSQFELLKRLKTSYMFVSPIPHDVLEQNGLVTIPCPLLENNNKDVLIYSSLHQKTIYEEEFIREVKKTFQKTK